jgi:hypothetical protein
MGMAATDCLVAHATRNETGRRDDEDAPSNVTHQLQQNSVTLCSCLARFFVVNPQPERDRREHAQDRKPSP